MDYKHWSEFLTEEEFENWEVEALIVNSRDEFFDESYNIFVNNYESLHSFVSSSFAWRNTKQGHDYWRTISNREN